MWRRVTLENPDGAPEIVEAREWLEGMPDAPEYPAEGEVLIRAAGAEGDSSDDRSVVGTMTQAEFDAALA